MRVELARTAAAASSTAPTAGPTETLIEFARGADLLLIEATLPRPERTGDARPPHPARGRRARARRRRQARCCSTHISDELDELWAREEAADGVRRPGRGRHARAPSTSSDRPPAYYPRLRCPSAARPLRELRAHAPRDRRAVRRRLRAQPASRAGAASRPQVDVYYCGNPPRAVVKVDLAGVDIDGRGASRSAGASCVIAGERRDPGGRGPRSTSRSRSSTGPSAAWSSSAPTWTPSSAQRHLRGRHPAGRDPARPPGARPCAGCRSRTARPVPTSRDRE